MLGSVSHLVFRKCILFCFNSYNYGCGVRSLMGCSRIFIPDKERDLLGAPFGSEMWSTNRLMEGWEFGVKVVIVMN